MGPRPNTLSTSPPLRGRLLSSSFLRWSAVVLLASLLSESRTNAQTTEPPAPPPANFAIASYNVNYGNADLRGVVRTILDSKADVVALQETNRRSERHLRRTLTKTYPYMVFRHAPAAGGFAMLSKVPLEKPDYQPPLRSSGGWFGTQRARVMLGRRELMVLNVHLTATVPRRNTNTKALLALFARTEAVRDKEIRHIVGQLPERWPVVVLGDFNSIPTLSGVPDFMTRNGFTDCLAEVVKDADTLPTWHWKRAGTEYSLRLDYIFSARTSARTVGGRVIQSDASDHFLVTCSYQWLPVPVTLGRLSVQAGRVVYLVDAADMTPERTRSARELVGASVAKLKVEQYLCVGVAGPKKLLVPEEPVRATEENKTAASRGLPAGPQAPGLLLAALRKAMNILSDEAAPKALFIVSDRLAKDPKLLEAVRSLHTDKRLQLYLVDAGGKPIPSSSAVPLPTE